MTKTQHSPLQLAPGDNAASLPGIKVAFCLAADRAVGWPPPHPSPTYKVTATYSRLITDSKFK